MSRKNKPGKGGGRGGSTRYGQRGGPAARRAEQGDQRRKVQGDRDDRARKKLLDRYEGVEPDGLVLCQYGSHADVVFADGSVRFSLLTPKMHKLFGLCVGDRVWTQDGATPDERVIVARAARRTEVRRKRGEEDRTGHVIAANVDQMAITVALHEPPLRTGALDRYLVLASVLGLDPIIVLTKTDLAPEDDPGWNVLAPYRELGHPVLATSAMNGAGLDALRAQLAGRVTVFSGHSGVGKSALCQALGLVGAPATGELSHSGGRVRGRHTTSVARLLDLPGGGWVVDTPGVRAIGLVDLSRQDAAVHFPELAELASGCGFSDCSHLSEEDCAVRAAVEAEELSRVRYDGYVRLMESLD